MSLYRLNVVAKDPKDETRATPPLEVLVDTGAELTWLPGDQLSAIGLRPRRDRVFRIATGDTVVRKVGYAVLGAEGYETSDEVVFAEKTDASLLGVRTVEGFGVLVDAVGHRLDAVSTIAAAGR